MYLICINDKNIVISSSVFPWFVVTNYVIWQPIHFNKKIMSLFLLWYFENRIKLYQNLSCRITHYSPTNVKGLRTFTSNLLHTLTKHTSTFAFWMILFFNKCLPIVYFLRHNIRKSTQFNLLSIFYITKRAFV